MDPEQTLVDLRNHISVGNFGSAVAALNAYYQWRLKGGYEPTNGDYRASEMAIVLTDDLDSQR